MTFTSGVSFFFVPSLVSAKISAYVYVETSKFGLTYGVKLETAQ